MSIRHKRNAVYGVVFVGLSMMFMERYIGGGEPLNTGNDMVTIFTLITLGGWADSSSRAIEELQRRVGKDSAS